MAEVDQSFAEHDGNHEGEPIPENPVPEEQVPEYEVPEYQVPNDEVPEYQIPIDEVAEEQVPEDSQAQQKLEHEGDSAVGGGEKKWPGWPGESVFRMLVPAQKVGSIIGRKGEFIKKIVEETRARIKILDGPPGTTERAVPFANFKATNQNKITNLKDQRSRLQGSALSITKCCKVDLNKYEQPYQEALHSLWSYLSSEDTKNFVKLLNPVFLSHFKLPLEPGHWSEAHRISREKGHWIVMISAKEEPDSSLPPAMDGLLRVHKRIVDGLDGDSSHPPPGGKVSTRLLVPASQAGSLIGKQGGTVKSIQEASSCIVRVLGAEDLPVFALQDDRVVEVVGDATGVHKAIELIASHLRKFLVDRSIIPLFEMHMQMANPQIEHMPPHQSWGPPQGLPPNASGGPGFGPNHQYMPPPRQVDNYYPAVDLPPPMEKQPHQGISAYGREAPMGVHASSNTQSAPSMITQITQQMQIPLSYADAVIGTAGASISYIRRSSGATVTIQETRGVPGEMTVEISGTASQVQTAQQLIQAYPSSLCTTDDIWTTAFYFQARSRHVAAIRSVIAQVEYFAVAVISHDFIIGLIFFNFMAEAAAPSQAQMSGSTDQGYNPYATHSSMYGSPPSNPGHASHTGGYGSVYGSNYGY
ncbi:hypothetical protein Patl1_23261 [Pistacia atlantica]|uniref:Uncharacterized protein n=1 Tax=Pistacia atlantica TaxID=434234 RepID=A0ACC1A116_9ROSI|nr:hypothetical protein Patl1_23261 [Pistacia atlantica]